jgi:transposase
MEDTSAIPSLPNDPGILKSMIAVIMRERDAATRQRDTMTRERDTATRQRDEVQRQAQQLEIEKRRIESEKQRIEIEKLRLEVELLRFKKWYYGPRADRLQQPGDVAQLLLQFGQALESRPVNPGDVPVEPGADTGAADADAKNIRRVRKGRRNLADFEHLPAVRKVHDLAEDEKPCPGCGEARQKIGEESSWQVEYIPGRFERIEHVRIKYACKHCEQNAENPRIELAEKPIQPIDKGMAGPGLLAYVVASKYSDYLPLYRLQNIFQRNGFEIDRATQSVWCGDVADLFNPLYELMVERVLQSHVICTDDTVMPMLAPEKTKPARMWVYVGDEHNPYNVFQFTLSRSRDGPAKFLKDYKETLLADAYGGYDGVVVASGITRAGCWAHARRKFVDAEKTHPQIATEAVGWIKRLYAIERQASSLENADRLHLRQSQSMPILSALRDRLFAWKDQLLPKHPMSEAVGYALNQWAELNVFAGNGAVPIDNNISEREMKRIVLNRKNSLFVGNERGGRTAAILSSITSTCRRHGIDPQHYLTQLLTNLPTTPMTQLTAWLPDAWKRRTTSRAECG